MKKSMSSIGSIMLMAVMTSSPSAGELNTDPNNTLNVFVAGTTAVAADVNDNFSKVVDAVNDNNTQIDANTAAITSNTTAITALQTDKLNSADLGSALDTATTTAGNSIDGNTADIVINAAAISVHTTAISNNAANIANNTADIVSNTAAIINNTADIADNTTAIAANTTAIAGKLSTSALGTALDTTTTTAGNSIDGNAADIAANAADIASNTQNSNKTGIPCSGNDVNDEMVRVGPLCVDKYEASVWDSASGGGTQYGTSSDDYLCNDSGNDCSASAVNPIYARSEANVTPSANITWFQAQQACANSGKRLLTNAEWQMAAAGTPDPGAAGDGTTTCNTNTAGVLATGNSSTCVSNWLANDMVGNVWEWVADWMAGTGAATATATNNATYGNDAAYRFYQAFTSTSGTFPAAIYRGGANGSIGAAGVFAFASSQVPSLSDPTVGFRCAR
jgi:formylglycine-generating enzyme required for sulfatase activity